MFNAVKIIILFYTMLFVNCSFAGFDEGLDAYEEGAYDVALKEWRVGADQGDAKAQSALGVLYANGLGVTKDETQALQWHRKAADQGNANAQYNLGLMYANGQGVAKDMAQAAQWFRKAADQGLVNAQYSLGIMYDNGQGVAKDEAQAAQWFRKAADQGNAEAQYNLGLMYEKGQGVAKDGAQAVQWYRKAADQGLAEAQYNLGLMYEKGQGVAKDGAQAVQWYRKAADQGFTNAQYNLGIMYKNGQGVAKDEAQAVHWYRKAADQGDAEAKAQVTRLIEKTACLKKANTKLFDEALRCTTKDDLRTAAKNAGGKVIQEDDEYWYDQYDSSTLLEGTSQLSIAYINDKFAKAFYTYNSDMDTSKVVEVRDMVAKKYGKPITSNGTPSVGPVTYTWKLKDGIQLKVSRDWPDATVLLEYIHTANFAAMEKEQDTQKRAEEAEKRGKQNKAF